MGSRRERFVIGFRLLSPLIIRKLTESLYFLLPVAEDAELAAFLSEVTPTAAAAESVKVVSSISAAPILASTSARKPPTQPVDAIVSISMKPVKLEAEKRTSQLSSLTQARAHQGLG
jgi:hypothetical protein